MSKTAKTKVSVKTKREIPTITTRPEATNRRQVAIKPSTTSATTTAVTKKPITKPTDEKNKNRPTQSVAIATDKLKAKPTAAKLTTSSSVGRNSQAPPLTKHATQQSTSSNRYTSSNIPAQRQQPIRAKHTTEIKQAIQKNSPRKTEAIKYGNVKPNAVLNTPHNVTVSSPPSKRRETETVQTNSPQHNSKLMRRESRVLAPDEIVVLKRESAKKRLEEQILRDNIAQQQQEQNSLTSLPDPVAFEVNFEEKTAKRERSRSRVRPGGNESKTPDDDANYSDDFDSYESDFDTETSSRKSSPQQATEESQEEASEKETSDEECSSENASDNEEDDYTSLRNKAAEETEDESELTQDPITVLQRDKERKLDSGHYEMNTRRQPKLSEATTSHLVDSLEAFSLSNSDQLDSGISAYGPLTSNSSVPTSAENFQVFYGGYRDFSTRPILNKRGSDLMAKLQFDSLGFTLLDLKPVSYDVFMQTFGRLNSGQIATQTQDNLMHAEQQTDSYDTRNIWTQHPAQYDLDMVRHMYEEVSFKGMFAQNCCGEVNDKGNPKLKVEGTLDNSLETLKMLENQRHKRNVHNHVQNHRKPVNYESLNSFLLRSSLVINQILGSIESKVHNSPLHTTQKNLSGITDSCYRLDTNFLNTLKVIKIFSNPCHNLFVTVHESLPETDVYKTDFSQLLMVWCINSPDKPMRLLTTWSEVSRLEISYDSVDIIVAALRDGSIALWDLRETYSFCSKLDGCLTHFAATQSIVPSWEGQRGKTEILMDLGACLDIRSFRRAKSKLGGQTSGSYGNKSQFVTLHDSGIITVWSLVESSEITTMNILNSSSQKSDMLKYSSKLQQKFGYSSPWARVKLIQSSIAQLKDYLESTPLPSQSRFDKTKALFQSNIYSDEALKELHGTSDKFGQQGLRFTSLECGSENIYICANRNFILMCSKTLKAERFRRIILNESRLLFPTALRVLSNEHFLAVGLSNGAVMILNCAGQQKNRRLAEKCKTPVTPYPGETYRTPYSDVDSVSGKSCAIQNIVLNSQKSFNSMDFSTIGTSEEFRPNTAAFIALIDSQQKPFELRVHDQQVILSGSVLRRNLIQSLELSSDGWRLFAVTNNRIRIYDFCLDQEVGHEEEIQDAGTVMDIVCSKANSNDMKLLMLENDSKVIVCNLKK